MTDATPTPSPTYAEVRSGLTMPLVEAMTTQRAVRRLKPDPVDDDIVLRCIELALKAPTGSNGQNWEFVVVKDRPTKAALAERYRLAWKLYGGVGQWMSEQEGRGIAGAFSRVMGSSDSSDGAAMRRMLRAVEWQVDNFEDLPVLVIPCLRGGKAPFVPLPPIATSSYYGSIYPSVQNLLLAGAGDGPRRLADHHAAVVDDLRAAHPRPATERAARMHRPARLAEGSLRTDHPPGGGRRRAPRALRQPTLEGPTARRPRTSPRRLSHRAGRDVRCTRRAPTHRRSARHPPMRRPRIITALALVLTMAVTVTACGSDTKDTTSPATTGTTNPASSQPGDPFYVAPDPLPAGKPGDVIRSEPLAGAPSGSQAWKVLYLSTGLDGAPIAVSGIVVAPTSPTTGTTGGGSTAAPVTGNRPILSWAHPTTGVVDDCAPSTMSDVFALIPGLDTFLAAGYVVAATDYEGLGTPGVHPYLIGESEARGVLDTARAARNLPDTGAGSQLLLWGHSQGGQASLFAGQLAKSYAPDLQLLATAATAPAGELRSLLSDDSNTPEGVVLGGYAVNAYMDIYSPANPGMSESQVVTDAGQAAIPQIVQLCDLTQSQQLGAIAEPLSGKFFVGDPGSVQPWSKLLADNTPGGSAIPSPVLVTQGTADTIVIPSTTAQLVTTYSANGTNATEKTYDGVTHTLIGYQSAGEVATWMAGIVAGNAPPPGCS